MRIISFLFFTLLGAMLFSQDTLRVMHYNLLDYGNAGFCTNNTNNTDQKDAYLRAVVAYAKPDIFTVNEISSLSTYQERVLSQVMNQTGFALFAMGNPPNHADSYIVNQLYYNSEKLALHSQYVAQSELRDIDVYSLYYLSDNLASGDTVFIHCIIAHLKAGSGSDDEARRALMTSNALNFLEANARPGNYLFMGDFNMYESSDDAFQLMTGNDDPVFRFYDPVDEIGDWHENFGFQHVHTQSTRGSASGCGASGGMDDRFDFILMNETLMQKADRAYYLEGSYHAFGQDGNRLNGTIKDPPNTSLPAYLVDALYGMSDHLPVVMDLVIDETLHTNEINTAGAALKLYYSNPATHSLQLRISAPLKGVARLSLHAVSGGMVYNEMIVLENNASHTIPLGNLRPGLYILRLEHERSVFAGKVVLAR